MTTAKCADVINKAVGERIVDDRYIRNKVEVGELEPINPNKRPRERYRISRTEFLRFIAEHHENLVDQIQQQLNVYSVK
jgi:hypothetical protein